MISKNSLPDIWKTLKREHWYDALSQLALIVIFGLLPFGLATFYTWLSSTYISIWILLKNGELAIIGSSLITGCAYYILIKDYKNVIMPYKLVYFFALGIIYAVAFILYMSSIIAIANNTAIRYPATLIISIFIFLAAIVLSYFYTAIYIAYSELDLKSETEELRNNELEKLNDNFDKTK